MSPSDTDFPGFTLSSATLPVVEKARSIALGATILPVPEMSVVKSP